MKVLVTGATGFLGKRLALTLKEKGYEVTAIGRNERIGYELTNNNIHFVKCDLREHTSIAALCKGKNYVFHCGALSSPWGKYTDFYDTNVVGTKNIIEGCLNTNIERLIHVSTPSIYFSMKDSFNISENTELPKKPINHYAKTKLMAEKEIDDAYNQGLPVITIRPRGIFGPGDTSIIPRLIKTNQQLGVPLINDGKALIDVTYVDNVVDALLLCIDSPKKTLGQKYNITNGEPLYFIDLLKLLFEKLNQPLKIKEISFKKAYTLAYALELLSKTVLRGKEPVLTRYTVGILSKSQTLDINAAMNDLNYIPRISINEGLNEFVKWWYQENDR